MCDANVVTCVHHLNLSGQGTYRLVRLLETVINEAPDTQKSGHWALGTLRRQLYWIQLRNAATTLCRTPSILFYLRGVDNSPPRSPWLEN